MENVTDTLFGTKYFTHGAEMQLPRKVPLRIEPKSYFANERTFLAWMHMAITMGGITTALASFSVESDNEAKHTGSGPVTKRTTQAIVLMLLPISIGMIAYALFTFFWRSRCMERKQMGFFNDVIGPVVLCALIVLSLATIMMMSIVDFFR
ncbi:hypothetical protein ABBQ38_004775 [Trebouxia sp. C0009 RCD-2024]